MCYYMHNCIRVTVVKRLNIEAFWFFCAVLPLQKVGQTIGITSSAQLWQYIKYSQFRFLQLYYTTKQLSCQLFWFFAKLSCPQSGCRSFPARIFILVSRKGAQRQRVSPAAALLQELRVEVVKLSIQCGWTGWQMSAVHKNYSAKRRFGKPQMQKCR